MNEQKNERSNKYKEEIHAEYVVMRSTAAAPQGGHRPPGVLRDRWNFILGFSSGAPGTFAQEALRDQEQAGVTLNMMMEARATEHRVPGLI